MFVGVTRVYWITRLHTLLCNGSQWSYETAKIRCKGVTKQQKYNVKAHKCKSKHKIDGCKGIIGYQVYIFDYFPHKIRLTTLKCTTFISLPYDSSFSISYWITGVNKYCYGFREVLEQGRTKGKVGWTTGQYFTFCGALIHDVLYPNCNEEPPTHTVVAYTNQKVHLPCLGRVVLVSSRDLSSSSSSITYCSFRMNDQPIGTTGSPTTETHDHLYRKQWS